MATLNKTDWSTIASGSFTLNGATLTYYIEAKLTSQSISGNSSKCATRARTVFSGYTMGGAGYSFSCTGCTTKSGTGVYYYSSETVLTGSTTITHNNDGTGKLSMSGKCTNTYLGMNISISGSIDLPKIARNSTITSFSAFNIENGFTFGYKDDLADKTLTLAVKLGSTIILTKSYTSAVGSHSDAITFTSEQLVTIYGLMPTNSKTASFTLELTTSGISTTSTKSANGSLLESVNRPMINSVTFTELALTGYGVTNDTVVQYLSRKLIAVNAIGVNGATISRITVANGNSPAVTLAESSDANTWANIFENLTSGTFTVNAIDSRGFVTPLTVTKTFIAYVYPTITNVVMDRDSNIVSSGYINVTGTFWNGGVGSIQQNAITWTYKLNESAVSGAQTSATYTNNTWTDSVSLASGTLERNSAYTGIITATDSFGQSATYTVTLGIAVLVVWLGKYTVRAGGLVAEKVVIHNPFTDTDMIIGGYLEVGTYTDKPYYGVGGYITSGGNAAVLNIPVGLIGFENLVLTKISCSIRAVDSAYLGGQNNIDLIGYLDLTNYPDDLMYIPEQGILRVILRNSNGWSLTNNSPIFGDVVLSYNILSNS